MKKYTIRKGDTNFKPYDNFLPRIRPLGFVVEFKFDPSAWWSPESWDNDADYNDELKLKGLTDFWSANDNHSAMVSWRPVADQPNTWRVSPYLNYPGTTRTIGEPLIVRGNDSGKFVVTFKEDGTVHYIGTVTSSTGVTKGLPRQVFPFQRTRVMREVGTWFGGANNSAGPYGGKAHKDMTVFIDFSITK